MAQMLNFLVPEASESDASFEILLVLAGSAPSRQLPSPRIAGPRHVERQRAYVARRVGVMENCPVTGVAACSVPHLSGSPLAS